MIYFPDGPSTKDCGWGVRLAKYKSTSKTDLGRRLPEALIARIRCYNLPILMPLPS